MNNPQVSIIVPFYNESKYLPDSLASLSALPGRDLEFLLCDDKSTDTGLEIVRKFARRDKRIRVITAEVNGGAAANKNRGAAAARSDMLIFLDSDTRVTADWLKNLLIPLKNDPSLSAAQSLIMDYDDPELIQQAGGKLVAWTGWLQALHQWTRYDQTYRSLSPIEIVAVSGSLAVRRAVFEAVGGFDELSALHSEDVDFSWRMWVMGYVTKLAPASRMYHRNKPLSQRALMNATKESIHFHLVKNSLRSMIKNYELLSLIKFLPISVALNLVRCAICIYNHNWDMLRGTGRGLWWNIQNLDTALARRRFIQSHRRYQDSELFRRVFYPVTLWNYCLSQVNLFRVHTNVKQV